MIRTREAWRIHWELARLIGPMFTAAWTGNQDRLDEIWAQVSVLHARRDALRRELRSGGDTHE